MIVFVFYLSHCWGECATVGEVGQTVNLLPSGWVGSNPTTPTTISAKVKCFGKEYARLWRWAYLVCRCSTMVQCSSLPSWRWGFDSLHLLKLCRYSTTVSVSACHAEDVSSILIICSINWCIGLMVRILDCLSWGTSSILVCTASPQSSNGWNGGVLLRAQR